jgi:hypothetical protein
MKDTFVAHSRSKMQGVRYRVPHNLGKAVKKFTYFETSGSNPLINSLGFYRVKTQEVKVFHAE